MSILAPRASLFIVLAIAGILVSFYAAKIHNTILLIAAILFTIVSADNISCSLKKKEEKKKIRK